MKISELKKRLETENVEFRGLCHDCGAPVSVVCSVGEEGKIIIRGGAIYNPKMGLPPATETFFKCDECFKKDSTLRNFVKCEVYSRVVGYLRPVKEWNKGKREEYKQRKEFIVNKK